MRKRKRQKKSHAPNEKGMTLITTFTGGATGMWRVENIQAISGSPLAMVKRVAVFEGYQGERQEYDAWRLRGVTSYERYVHRAEREQLVAVQPDLGRAEATRAALIPIRKSAAWWDLTQDERRAIFEEQSHHIGTGLKYLPAVARRLYHSRDLGEPFDFLTWFEYAPTDAAAFDELVQALRQTEEWKYVEREVDIRLIRET